CGSDSGSSPVCHLISGLIVCGRACCPTRKAQFGDGYCQCGRVFWSVYHATFNSSAITECRLVSGAGGQCDFDCPDCTTGLDAESTNVYSSKCSIYTQ